MVRVSNSVRLMQSVVTCHIDLATTGLIDRAHGVLFQWSYPLKNEITVGGCAL